MDEARGVREFWFGNLLSTPSTPPGGPSRAQALKLRMEFWFGGDEAQRQRDSAIRTRFAGLAERAANGSLASWADSPRRCLSLIILLDQFPRSLFRGTARAYAYDEQALGLTLSGMQSAADGALDVIERMFFYMPLQHSESLEVQEESVAACRRLVTEAPEDLRDTFQGALQYAQMHRTVIERFGRFPHRNRVLDRANTPEEAAYLRSNVAKFGE